MRIKITFTAYKNGQIDFNYQHQIQSVIYKFLSNSNPDYAEWLHEEGYVYKREQNFKFFVFSGITFNGKIKISRLSSLNGSSSSSSSSSLNSLNSLNGLSSLNGFLFTASPAQPFTFSFQIASPVNNFLQYLIDGIFKTGQEILLGRQSIIVHRVETLSDPLDRLNSSNRVNSSNSSTGLSGLNSLNDLNCLNLFSLCPLESPLFVKMPSPKGERDIYLFPGDEYYETLLNQNLIHKYETLYGNPYEGEHLKFEFPTVEIHKQFKPFKQFERLEPVEQFKQFKQFTIFKTGPGGSVKPVHIKGTLRPFNVSGPTELIRIGLECGFGQNNSIGCGYVEKTVQTV